jgi:hypothetical protein
VLDWLADHLALIMFVAMFFVIFMGYPVAFIMGGMARLFALAGWALGVFKLIGLYDIVLRMWAASPPIRCSPRSPCSSSWGRSSSDPGRRATC